MIWIVTGPTGLIGRVIVRRLLDRGERVLALSRSAESFFANWQHPRLTARRFDLAQDRPDALHRIGIDEEVGVVMLSSIISTSTDLRSLAGVLDVDTYGHLRLAEHLLPRLRFGLYASSCTVYGRPASLPVDEAADLDPQNVYALAKVASERALSALLAAGTVPFCIARISQVYGPGAPLIGAVYTFLDRVAQRKRPQIRCNPDAYRDYCHVEDAVEGLMGAVERRAEGVYNVGSGSATTVERLARICMDVAGMADDPECEPRTRAGNMLLDIRRASRELSYVPRIGIEEGVQREYKRLFGRAGERC